MIETIFNGVAALGNSWGWPLVFMGIVLAFYRTQVKLFRLEEEAGDLRIMEDTEDDN